jgi:hypothetical protein
MALRPPRALLAVLCLLALVLVSAPSAAGAAGARAPLVTGITDPITTYESPFLAYQRMHQAGARFVRLTIGWTEVAPRKEPNQWQPSDPADPYYWWPTADREVTSAVAAGLTPLIVITGAPDWAQGCGNLPYPGAVCNPDRSAFFSFVTAIARRYSGSFQGLPRVRYWTPFNEPNLFLFFNPQFGSDNSPVSPEIYREVLRGFSAAVKAVDPSNLVVSAGLAPLARPGGLGPMAFARQLLCMTGRRVPRPLPGGCGGGVPIDIFAMNPYTTGGPTHKAAGADDVSLGDLAKLRRLLDAADGAGHLKGAFKRTPLWITEFSWDSKPPDPRGLPQRLLARWVSEALFRAWRAGVSVFFWYGLRDEAPEGRPTSLTAESGLYFRGPSLEADRPKLALTAFRFPFVALNRKGGFLVWGRVPSGKAGSVEIQVRGGDRWRRVAKLTVGVGGTFQARLHRRYSRTGSVRAVQGEQRSLPFSLRYVEDFYQPPLG